MTEQSEVVKRALAYPYAIPEASFTLVAGRVLDLGAVEVNLSTRTPLLAYGSNAAPEVLARKLGAETDPLPVIRAALADFDVVYSAHISAYGSVPATVRRSPGTESTIFVAHPTDEQLRRISATEPNYELTPLQGIACTSPDGRKWEEAAAYVSRHGCLTAAGSEVALESVPARARRFPAMSEAEVLEWARRELCPERSLESFVEATVSSADASRGWGERLRAGAIASM